MAGGGPELGDLLSLGLTLAGCLVIGYGIGWGVDQLAGSFPVFALIGIALGIAGACIYFYKMFKRYQ